MTATPKLPPEVKAARRIAKSEAGLLTPREFGLMQHALITICYAYSTVPLTVMATGGHDMNVARARQALAVAARELGLSWHKIAQFTKWAHTTAIHHFKNAAFEAGEIGTKAAEDALVARAGGA